MSPPIYTPDGSEVSEIVLPDGSAASEVIGPDGNVVFEAAPDIPDIVDDFNYLTAGESIDGQENWFVASGIAEGGDGSDGDEQHFDSTIYLRYTGGASATKSVEAGAYGTVEFLQSIDGTQEDVASDVTLENSTDGVILRSTMTDTGGFDTGALEVNGTQIQTGITDGVWYELSFALDWDAEEIEVSVDGSVQDTVAFVDSTTEADVVGISSEGSSHVGLLENLTLGE